ncbi:hypothetical protein [Pararhodospirillum photometricum]|nr:hypothetical protein [Pararhodospirillum photometricum]
MAYPHQDEQPTALTRLRAAAETAYLMRGHQSDRLSAIEARLSRLEALMGVSLLQDMGALGHPADLPHGGPDPEAA